MSPMARPALTPEWKLLSWLGEPCAEFEFWRNGTRQAALAHLAHFAASRAVPQLGRTGIEIAPDVLTNLIDGGKCLRSTFMYLGWLCGHDAGPDAGAAALRAAAGLEMLHAFALLQDDADGRFAAAQGRAKPLTSASPGGTASAASPGRPTGSAPRWRSCYPICAWCGPSR